MLSNALAFLKKDAANAATFMPLAAGGGPAGHVPSPDSLPLILRVSTVGPSYGRVLTNFLAAKTLKRKVLISAWSCDHPHSRRHARTGRRPRRMENKGLFLRDKGCGSARSHHQKGKRSTYRSRMNYRLCVCHTHGLMVRASTLYQTLSYELFGRNAECVVIISSQFRRELNFENLTRYNHRLSLLFHHATFFLDG